MNGCYKETERGERGSGLKNYTTIKSLKEDLFHRITRKIASA